MFSKAISVVTFICTIATALAQPVFVYRFDAANAAGIEGVIHVKYAGEDSTVATVHAALDFSRLNQTAIQSLDRLCAAPVTSFEWHIHVRWSSPLRSASFGQCSLADTGNHYDPLFACSPNSEHINSPICQTRSKRYDCTPETYAKDPRACEKGDLSGKFGLLVLNDKRQAGGTWVDKHFPKPSEDNPNWSIVLHAVCGNHASRTACAVEQQD